MKIMRKIIKIDEELCNGCGNCVVACAEGAIEIIDGVAKVIADKYCDGLGACLGECPTGALEVQRPEMKIIFDQEKCSVCELCVPACPPRAMEIRPADQTFFE